MLPSGPTPSISVLLSGPIPVATAMALNCYPCLHVTSTWKCLIHFIMEFFLTEQYTLLKIYNDSSAVTHKAQDLSIAKDHMWLQNSFLGLFKTFLYYIQAAIVYIICFCYYGLLCLENPLLFLMRKSLTILWVQRLQIQIATGLCR